MPRRLLLTLIALGLAMALTAPVAAGGGTLDQQQNNPPNNAHAVAGVIQPAQVFTAGLTGQLDQVDLYLVLGLDGSPGDDLTVEIWTVTSGAPASPVPGASATVLAASLSLGVSTWVQVPISAPSVAGTQYAIVLSASAADLGDCPDICWQWLTDDSGPYAGGLSYFSQDSGATWIAQARDFNFRTYVAVPAPPTPAASLVNAAMATPEPAGPWALLGFAVLLICAFGVLAAVNARGAISRK